METMEQAVFIPDSLPILETKPTTKRKALSKWIIPAAVGGQALLLLGFVAPYGNAVAHGTNVTLQAQLYDPHHPLKGDYLNLSYDVENSKPAEKGVKEGQDVYVVLEHKNGKHWTAKSVLLSAPKNNETFIKAKFIGGEGNNSRHLSIGLDQFYIPEGTGNNVQSSDKLDVSIAVGKDGTASIKGVSSNGKAL